jgi:RNA polymerase sigma-70 factor (ECF subfamily)
MVEPLNTAFFPTTCWSQVGPGAAGGGDGVTDRALERLASRYWRPIRDWLRAELRLERDAAAELTQDFFVWVIESGFLRKADPERGRFRAFLKVALRNYARDVNRRATAARRGGGRKFFSIDEAVDGASGTATDRVAEEKSFDVADPNALRPDELLDQRWRRELVQTALQELEKELAATGKSAMFATFRDYFLDASPDVDYRGVAERNGITVTDVTNWLTRTKRRFREHLLALVTDTVRDAAALEEELHWLFQRPENKKDAP